MKDERVYLEHIRDALTRIAVYISEGEARFFAETIIQDAVLRNLQTLAEATQRLSEDRKGRFPLIDWRAMAGFRNVIVHTYLGINVARIWQIVAADLPPLRQAIDAMLAELDAQE